MSTLIVALAFLAYVIYRDGEAIRRKIKAWLARD
jgi:hypothetical protein